MPFFQYPNEFVSDEEKQQPSYGKKFFDAVWSQFGGWKVYSERRNRMLDLRRWRSGGQSIQDMKDLMGTAGDTSWLNLDWEPNRTILEKSDRIIEYLCQKKYKVTCDGADSLSISERDKARKKLYAKALLKPYRKQFEEEYNIKLQSSLEEDFDTKEDVDVFMEGEFKLSVEVAMELGINYFLKLNRFEDIRRKLYDDLWTVGKAVTHVSTDGETITVKYVDAVNAILPQTKSNNFMNAKYICHIEWLTLGDIRKAAGTQITDEQYLEIARVAKCYNDTGIWGYNLGNGAYYQTSITNYQEWDNLDVPVLMGEFRAAANISYESKTNHFGRKSVYRAKGDVVATEKHYRIDKEVEYVYTGCYIPDLQIIYNYGKKPFQPRDRFNGKYDLTGKLGYCVYQPNNYDNFNVSPVMRMITYAKKMNLVELRMQHLIAKASPGGYAVNVNALLELKEFVKDIKNPLDAMSMFLQTGILFYKGQKDDGSPSPSPLTYTQGIDLAQLNSLMQQYEWARNELERSIGGQAVGMGASAPDRAAVGVQEMAQMASDNALGPVTYGVEDITVRMCTQISRFIQYLQKEGTLKKYSLAFTTENQSVVKDMQELPMRDFNIFVKYALDLRERAYLEAQLQAMIDRGELRPEDAFWIRETDDLKLAYMYMRKQRTKLQQEKMAMVQQTGEEQRMSAQVAEQSKQQTLEVEAQLEIQTYAAKKEIDKKYEEYMHQLEMQKIEAQAAAKYKTAIDVAGSKSMQQSDLVK